MLADLYRAWPWRPHCRNPRHAWPCKIAAALSIGPECDFPAPPKS